MDEVADVGPVGAVFLVEAEGRAQALLLHRHPDLADRVGRQFALAPRHVHARFEVVEGDLAHHRVQHVLDLARQHGLARGLVGRGLEQRLEGQHLAEHRGGLGQRERRVGHQRALPARQHLVHAVAQLVGQRHDVPHLALVVEQQIGMRRRHRGMGEGARRLARPRRRVDPGIVEELPAHRRQLRREGAVGVEHDLRRLGPLDHAVVVLGQRRVAVPVGHRLDAEPLGLELVVAVGEPRIGRLHRGGERVDHLVLDAVGEVHRGLRPRILAPAVLDLLVLGERVGDQREDRDIVGLDLAERLGRILADRGILARQPVEDLRLGQHLVAEGIAQPRDGLVEQARPGGAADDVFLVQRLLELVRQRVRAEGAQVAQPRAVLGEFRRLHLLGEVGILDPLQLQSEEQQLRADVGQALGDVLREAAALGIGHVAGVVEGGIGADAAHQVAHCLIAGDGGAQRLAVEAAHLALVVAGEGRRLLGRAPEVGREVRPGRAGIEVGQIPRRQIAQHCTHSPTPCCLGISGAAAMASRNRRPEQTDCPLTSFRAGARA